MVVGLCLICYEECASPDKNQNEEDFTSSIALVSKELHAMFILRNIFEVPHDSIEKYLETGANPSEWIALCGTCRNAVEKAKRIYREILNASRKFRKVKGDIIQYLRRTCSKKKIKEDSDKRATSKLARKGNKGMMMMTEETRTFVSKHNYSDSLVDPFVGGDCQAAKLLFSSNVVVADVTVDTHYPEQVIVKTEYISNDDNDDDCEDEGKYFEASPQSGASINDQMESTESCKSHRSKKKTSAKKEQKSDSIFHKANGSFKNSDGELLWLCVCGRFYTGKDRLRRHLKETNMDPSDMHECPVCDKQFKRRWDVKRHFKSHPGFIYEEMDDSNPNSLGIQEESSGEQAEDQNNHQDDSNSRICFHESSAPSKMADGTEYWNCSCGKIFLSQVTMQQHVEFEKSNAESTPTKITCPVCNATFKRRFDRNRHMKKDHGMDTANVQEQVSSHDGEGKIQHHVSDGGDEGPPVVSKQSAHSSGDDDEDEDNSKNSTLEREVHEELGLFEVSDGSEQWKCSCGRSYASQTALHRHANEKNMDPSKWLSCPSPNCRKSFVRLSQLKRHMEGVHQKPEFTCDKCGKVYSLLKQFQLHQKNDCSM